MPRRDRPITNWGDVLGAIQARNAGAKRRVMHGQNRRPSRVQLQLGIEPPEPFIINEPAATTGGRRIQTDDAKRPRVDGKARVRREGPQVAMIAKGPAERFAIIMVSRNQKVRNLEPPEDRPQSSILVRRTSFGEVAGREHHVRSRVQRVQPRDRPAQIVGRVGHVMQYVPAAPDVKIGNLRDDHTSSVTPTRYRNFKLGLVSPGHLLSSVLFLDALRPSDTPRSDRRRSRGMGGLPLCTARMPRGTACGNGNRSADRPARECRR